MIKKVKKQVRTGAEIIEELKTLSDEELAVIADQLEEVIDEIDTVVDENVDEVIEEEKEDEVVEEEEKKERKLRLNVQNTGKRNMDNESKSIIEMATKYKATDLGLRFLKEGKTLSQFKSALIEERSNSASRTDSDFADYQKEGYSIGRAVKALMDNNTKDGLVNAVSKDMRSKYGAYSKGVENSVFVPFGALKRDVTVGNPASAGRLVPNTLSLSGIDALYDEMVTAQAGAKMLYDLVGTYDIPRFDNVINAEFVAENGEAAGSDLATDFVKLSPKDLTANIQLSRSIRLQSAYNIEQLAGDQIRKQLALKMDIQALTGTGLNNSNKGVINETGIGSVTSGGTPTWQTMLALESAVAYKNALKGKGSYIGNAKLIELLKGTQKGNALNFIYEEGKVNSYEFLRTNALKEQGTAPADLTSQLLFGDFTQLIMALWGGFELEYNPYLDFNKGIVGLRAFLTFDSAVERAEAFALCDDIITTKNTP